MKDNLNLNIKENINYIHSRGDFAIFELKTRLVKLLENFNNSKIIILCIGSDRVTGDSLGPLVGYKLSKLPLKQNVSVYGTLEDPVHAKNLEDKISLINSKYEKKTIIAVDASLGGKDYINYITVGQGSIRPGAGINKDLPAVGDIFITGIVNISGILEISVLQNTRLSIVMNMADVISSSLWVSLHSAFN